MKRAAKFSNQTNSALPPNGVLDEHRLLDRLRRRPEEEDQRDRDLRRDQQIGQQLGPKDDALVHGAGTEKARPPRRRGGLPAIVLLVRALEVGKQLVAALDRRVERLLRRLLAGPHRLELLVDHVADLDEIADAQALGIVGRRLEVELLDRDVAPGELLVEALLRA